MNDVDRAVSQPWRHIYANWLCTFFWGVHLAVPAGILYTGWSWTGAALCLAWYGVLMFFVTAGHHRYFSHRTFKTSRPVQFLFGLGTTLAAQKGPLWWAAHHRRHHKESDGPLDVHSPVRRGFWFSHIGWILCRDFEKTDYDRIKDLSKYPELRWLNNWSALPPLALGLTVLALWGLAGLTWYLASIMLIWHGTFTINSLAHVFGSRRYDTSDDSRNNLLLALITHGEGWHNNHHHYQSSCRQGFRWYEIDMSYYILRLMQAVRLVSDVRTPPRHVVENRGKYTDSATPEPAPEPEPEDLPKAA